MQPVPDSDAVSQPVVYGECDSDAVADAVHDADGLPERHPERLIEPQSQRNPEPLADPERQSVAAIESLAIGVPLPFTDAVRDGKCDSERVAATNPIHDCDWQHLEQRVTVAEP